MSVYVDDARIPLGRMKMCHMVADTSDELLDMALALGLRVRWLQFAGTEREHFDVSLSKRRRALELGAVDVDSRKLVDLIRRKRNGGLSHA